MRKLGLFITALVFVLGTSTQAQAFSLANNYEGPLSFKFRDFSVGNIYQQSSGGYGQSDNVEDAWGIFKVTSIVSEDGSVSNLWSDGLNGEELTGMYYGLDDDFWTVDPGVVPGTFEFNIQSVGGRIDLYLDSSTSFNAALGPAGRIDADEYTNVTDGELFLSLEFVSGIKFGDNDTGNDHIAYDNNLDGTTSVFTGDGAFYLDVIGGSYAKMFDQNVQCITDDSGNSVCRDFLGEFATEAPGPSGWLVESNDPITGAAAAIPEPATMLMLGSSLFGIALRRRNKA